MTTGHGRDREEYGPQHYGMGGYASSKRPMTQRVGELICVSLRFCFNSVCFFNSTCMRLRLHTLCDLFVCVFLLRALLRANVLVSLYLATVSNVESERERSRERERERGKEYIRDLDVFGRSRFLDI